ncbi:MAG: sigma-70 family RNA polymerase sigma factor [Phycisphaerales bacterium]|nr:sigma-70 family RNA polymerase sigma factor [Phycisphaerales bacterium]
MDTTQTHLLWAVRESGNQEAWCVFFRIYAPMLRQFAKRLGLNEVESDDATQEVLIVVQNALRDGSYDPTRGKFRGWLYGVARNRALSAHRARKRRTRVQSAGGDTDMDLLSGIPDHREDALREVWEQEWRFALLEEAMRNLQPVLGNKAFRAFELYALQNLPVAEVAAELGIAPASVYTYKNRVLGAIKKWIARFDDDRDDASDAPDFDGDAYLDLKDTQH